MSVVRLIPLGVGEAFTAHYYTVCLAVGVDDDWLLVECPHPVRKMLREATTAAGIPFDLDRIVGAAVSHLHADHCSGLEDFGFFSYFALKRRARLLMHPEIATDVWNGLLAGGMGRMRDRPEDPLLEKRFDEYFDLIPLSESAATSVGPFEIECRQTLHSIPTTAFRIRAGGRVLGFSADTAYDPTLIDWLSSADLIVHEVTTYPQTAVHTHYEKLAALPAPLRAKMRLIHFPDNFDHAASVIEPLRQGQCYVL